MPHPHSRFRFLPKRQAARAGSTLLTALFTVLVLSLVAANVLSHISGRYNSAYRSASWNDALLAANAGIDVTLADLTSIVPNVSVSPPLVLGVGYTPLTQLPALNGLQISPTGLLTSPTGVLTKGVPLLTIDAATLNNPGDGGLTQRASVGLSLLSLNDLLAGGATSVLTNVTGLLNGNDMQLLRLTSTGTVATNAGRTASLSRLDNELWRASVLTDRFTGAALTQTTVTRQVQVILRPVRPYEAAAVSGTALHATDPGTVFDSFNSSLLTASTLGQYDSLKRLSHGSVRANGPDVALGGTVYGDAGTNGGTLVKDAHVTGTVSNTSYVPLPVVNPPTWSGNNSAAPAAVTGNTTLPTVVLLNPLALLPTAAQYRFTGISGTLTLSGVAGTSAEIYVDGELTGGITVPAGVTVKVYVSGSINTSTSRLKNASNLASNLQIYGVYKDATSTPSIRLTVDAALAAAIYAPRHAIYLSGSGDLSGAVTGSRFETSGPVRVHYDEALAYNAGPLLRYQIASWKEITN